MKDTVKTNLNLSNYYDNLGNNTAVIVEIPLYKTFKIRITTYSFLVRALKLRNTINNNNMWIKIYNTNERIVDDYPISIELEASKRFTVSSF